MAAEAYTLQNLSNYSFKAETTEGTAATDDLNDAILIYKGFAVKPIRTFIERNVLTGYLDPLPPLMGGFGASGFTVTSEMRGSGTACTAPETAQMLKNCFGGQLDGVAGAVNASPSPTTVAFTVKGTPTIVAGQVLRVQTGVSTYEYTKVVTAGSPAATVAVTVWPPLSAAPATDYTVNPGNSFILKSTPSDFTSGTGFFYFNNSDKLVFSGCRGTAAFTIAVGRPIDCLFTMDAMGYALTNSAIGYTPAYNVTTNPPICLGMTATFWYSALVSGTPSSTSVPLTASATLNCTQLVDKLVVDTSASASPTWETKTVATWTDSTQTATCSALGGAPTVGHTAYIVRSMPISNMKITVAPKWEDIPSISATYGVIGKVPTARTVTVSYDQKYKSLYAIMARDNLVSAEIWAVAGSTAGNIVAMYIPRFVRNTVDLKTADIMETTVTGEGYTTAGNDTIYMGFL